MTLSPPSFDMATISALNDFKQDDDDDGAMMPPSPISKPRPDMDDATPPPTNPRRLEEEPPNDEREAYHWSDCSFNVIQWTTVPSSPSPPPRPLQLEEDPEAESIALARMLMEQEAIESYGALSADYLRYNSHQFSQQDLAALQAAMAEDEGSDDGVTTSSHFPTMSCCDWVNRLATSRRNDGIW